MISVDQLSGEKECRSFEENRVSCNCNRHLRRSINSWPIPVRMGCEPRPLLTPASFLSMLKYWTSWSWSLYRKLSAGLAGGGGGQKRCDWSAFKRSIDNCQSVALSPSSPFYVPLGTPPRLLPTLGICLARAHGFLQLGQMCCENEEEPRADDKFAPCSS